MATTIMIEGKVETIRDDDDFANMLRDNIGYEAEEYFRGAIEDALDTAESNNCHGECDKVYSLQEDWENFTRDIKDELHELVMGIDDLTKKQIEAKIRLLCKKIGERV